MNRLFFATAAAAAGLLLPAASCFAAVDIDQACPAAREMLQDRLEAAQRQAGQEGTLDVRFTVKDHRPTAIAVSGDAMRYRSRLAYTLGAVRCEAVADGQTVAARIEFRDE